MTRPVTFSICIPNYNYARYLGLTIRSVLDQSYPHFEIIVADNASTDESVDVVKSFGDSRIKLIQNRANLGFAPNLDRATETATGDYMILLSSDDLMAPGALERYAGLIGEYAKDDADVVLSSDISIIDADGKTIGESRNLEAKGPIVSTDSVTVYRGLDLVRTVLEGSFTNIGKFLSTCYPRRLYERVGGYHSIMSVIPDAHFSHKVMLTNPLVVFVKEPAFHYRVHARNNYSSLNEHIKLLSDKYILSQLYTNEVLKPAGLTQADVQRNFVRTCCLMQPWVMLLTGRGGPALRHYAFGVSAYPGLMAREPGFWLIPLAFFLYPVFFLMHSIYKGFRGSPAS